MKKVLKVLAALALGVVVTMFASTEAKADEYADLLAYYAMYDSSYAAMLDSYYADYAKAIEMQNAAYYVTYASPYDDPYTYYYYANMVTDNALAYTYGSADAYAREIAMEIEYLYEQQIFMQTNALMTQSIMDIYSVYQMGEAYLGLTYGINPYAQALEQALNEYDVWLYANQKYWNY